MAKQLAFTKDIPKLTETNWSPWSFRLRNIFKSMKLQSCFNVKLYDYNGKQETVNVLDTSQRRSEVLELEEHQFDDALGLTSANDKKKTDSQIAFTLVVNAISDDLAYLAEATAPHPALTWCKLAEEYEPT